MHTACAPMASALMMSVPRRKPLSTRTGMRPPTTSMISGKTSIVAAAIYDTSAMVRNNDPVYAVVGGKFCVFARKNAF